jgi:hypothetical protein
MIGLRTARILVVDDNPLEALPIIHSLGRQGMGAVYVRGDKVEELPKQKLTGIRLIFLDMKLNIEGDDKEVVSKTVNVLKSIIDEKAHPSVIVLWTKHDELVKAFKDNLDRVMPNLRPGIILKVQKPFDYEDETRPPGLLRSYGAVASVEKAIKKHAPLDLLWYWEQQVHDAVSETMTALTQLIPPAGLATGNDPEPIDSRGSEEWSASMRDLLGAIVSAVGGATIRDGSSSLRAAFDGMNPLVSDRIAHLDHRNKSILASARGIGDQAEAERAKNRKKESLLSEEQRGSLNKMVLLAPSHKPRGLSHVPGNIYFKEQWSNVDEMSFPIGGKELKRSTFIAELVQLPDPKKQDSNQAAASAKKRRETILRQCHPFLLEFTPPCDYAQQNVSAARLMAGVAVPTEHGSRNGQYVKSLGPIHLRKSDGFPLSGSVHFVLNARYVFGISKSRISKQEAVCRLRGEPLSDVCSWFAGHAARPGFFCLY